MHDLVIRNAKIVDGTGAPAFHGDLAIDGDKVSAVGEVTGRGRREIDAAGRVLAPGWVDIHTHYDGQATWDPYLAPSTWHGCTTVVMGNCGVGFAPVRPSDRDLLVRLMEGVEDIPGIALHEGLKWNWESFPDFLNALEAMPHAIDFGVQLAHAPLRVYVMGERGARNEPATPEDIAGMAKLVSEALEAGALGFSTSRFLGHRSSDGDLVPGTSAGEDEIAGILQAMGESGRGFFQFVAGAGIPQREFYQTALKYSKAYKIPMSLNLQQVNEAPEAYRKTLDMLERDNADGAQMYGLVHGRTTGILMCLEGSFMPFIDRQAYQALAGLPHAEKVARLREPQVRKAILSEPSTVEPGFFATMLDDLRDCYELGDPPEYEPGVERSFGYIAAQTGRSVEEVAYDALLERDGRGLIYYPQMNYTERNLDATLEMMEHPLCRLGLADGGAHCGFICDVSLPTYLLTHWVRDRTRGRRVSLEWAVKVQTSDTAKLFGLLDRGVLKPGYKADLNLIDLEGLTLRAPEMVYDLPAGGRRFIQRADGYDLTICSGVVAFERGEPTGEMPGRLIRGATLAP